jgi:hypothetical protein
MRPSLALAIVACLFICGFRPDGLPFMTTAQFSDAAVSHYPAALTLYRDGYEAWTELNMAGQPFAANPLNKTAYPPQVLASFVPPDLFINIMLIFHILLAAFGMWAWARLLGLSKTAATVTALAYALSPRLIAHTAAGHIDLIYAMAWLPIIMYATHRFIARYSPLAVPILALAVSMMTLADLRLSLFGLGAAGFYAAVLLWQTKRLRVLSLSIVGGLVTLSTISLTLPLVLWQPYLSRTALTSAEAGAFSLQPLFLLGMFFPPPPIDSEMQTYLGITVVILALIAIISAPRKHMAWVALVVLAILYALGSNGFLWSALVEIFPPLRWFRVPARAWFIVTLVMALLAGYGAEAVFKRGHGKKLLPIALLALIFVDLALNARAWLEWRGRDAWMTPYAALAEFLRAQDADRIYSPTYSLPQQVAAEYDLHLFGGVDPFQLRGIANAIENASGVGNQGYSVTQPPLVDGTGDDLATANRNAIPDTQALAAWQVSHVVAPYPLNAPQLQLIRTIDGVFVYSNRDYSLTLPHDIVPRWANASDLPGADVVRQNNWLTTVTQFMSIFGILFTGVAYFYLWRQEQKLPT